MSDPGYAVVTAEAPRGMISLRGDLAAAKLKKLCTGMTGVTFPAAGQAQFKDRAGLAWMSPDEVLIVLPHGDVAGALEQIRTALEGQHHLATDVSEARALFAVTGPGCREVMAKLCPVDMAAFAPGQFRRTRMGQVAAAFWMVEAGRIEVVCFRSVADYAFDLLRGAAKGGPVGAF